MEDDTSNRRSVLSALGVPRRSRSRGSNSKSQLLDTDEIELMR